MNKRKPLSDAQKRVMAKGQAVRRLSAMIENLKQLKETNTFVADNVSAARKIDSAILAIVDARASVQSIKI